MPTCHLFHDWPKWSEPYAQPMRYFHFASAKTIEYTKTRQRRECQRCGKVQTRDVAA